MDALCSLLTMSSISCVVLVSLLYILSSFVIVVYTALTEGQFVHEVVAIPKEFIQEHVNTSGLWLPCSTISILLRTVCTVLWSNALYCKYTVDTRKYIFTMLYVLYDVQFTYMCACFDPLYCLPCLVCMLKGTAILYFLLEVRSCTPLNNTVKPCTI